LHKPEFLEQGKEVIDYHFGLLSNLANDLFTHIEDKIIRGTGRVIVNHAVPHLFERDRRTIGIAACTGFYEDR
jgi:hypothetical protein